MNKKVIFFIATVFIIISIIIAIIISANLQSNKNNSDAISPSPSPSNGQIPTEKLVPTESPEVFQERTDELQNRKELSDEDKKIREKLIESFQDQEVAKIYTSNKFVIYYESQADVFQVKFVNGGAEKDQEDAIGWFLSEGISSDGICNLPIVYFSFPEDENGIIYYSQPEQCNNK